MSDILSMTAAAARQALDNKTISAVELTEAYIKAGDDTADNNAYVLRTSEKAMDMAKASDARLAEGTGGLLEGIPIGVKDMFCTKGVETTASSAILKGFVPPYESTVTENLWQDGAVMLGKINCDEFAMGSANETSAFGAVINPWTASEGPLKGKALTPGGSSGGSAAAMAARSTLLAPGTDTGGSIRQPAAFCGLVGMKPTYGRCSRLGIVAFSSSLDQAGPITRDVADCALMMTSMSSHDKGDSTSIDAPLPDLMDALASAKNEGIKGMRIGIPDEYTVDGMPDQIVKLWETGRKWLEDAGASCVPVSLPHTQYALPAYYIIAPAEASSNLARYDGVRYGMRVDGESLDDMYARTRGAGFGDEVKRRILIGTYVLSAGYYDAYYIKAQKVRRLIQNDFTNVFADVDALLTPSTPSAAFAIGDESKDPLSMFLNDVFTVPANLAGIPAISVPAGLSSDGLPLGLQLIAPALREDTLIRGAAMLEQCADFHHVASGAAS
ncbi:MAG: Asp-tRNA(Asn)/Glu-tRNA(Gln) amidotransferase subunit GatA [Pseudomonadota bacterium]|nr:Asp-tRNA(Asn)/Glu-tRNA(Gln) amidotransferase subunit GatA [Pseudomonadota bacterium]